jgi:hypothetical protein
MANHVANQNADNEFKLIVHINSLAPFWHMLQSDEWTF